MQSLKKGNLRNQRRMQISSGCSKCDCTFLPFNGTYYSELFKVAMSAIIQYVLPA